MHALSVADRLKRQPTTGLRPVYRQANDGLQVRPVPLDEPMRRNSLNVTTWERGLLQFGRSLIERSWPWRPRPKTKVRYTGFDMPAPTLATFCLTTNIIQLGIPPLRVASPIDWASSGRYALTLCCHGSLQRI
ncbi:hypothetical protein BDW66DRAFT_77409 [Aspergillus desertorum]